MLLLLLLLFLLLKLIQEWIQKAQDGLSRLQSLLVQPRHESCPGRSRGRRSRNRSGIVFNHDLVIGGQRRHIRHRSTGTVVQVGRWDLSLLLEFGKVRLDGLFLVRGTCKAIRNASTGILPSDLFVGSFVKIGPTNSLFVFG